MSLQIWLPLVGNLKNEGLNPVSVATNNGATVNNSGKIGKCYSFGGSNYLTLPTSILENFTSDISCCAWVNISAWNTQFDSIVKMYAINNAWQNSIFAMGRNGSTNKLYFSIANGSSSTQTSCTLTENASLNTWYHMACTYDSTNKKMKIYLNGELKVTYSTTIVPNFNIVTSIGVGGSPLAAYGLKGLLNDFRLYNHVLSLRQIKEIAKALALHYPLNNNGLGNQNLLTRYVSPGSAAPGSTATSGRTEYYGDYGIIIPAQQNADTYFSLYSASQLISGETYTISCYVKNLLEGSRYHFPLFAQNNGTMGILKLNHNGLCSMTFTMSYEGSIPTATIDGMTVYRCFLDDSDRLIASGQGPITVTNFKIEKGSTVTSWVPFIMNNNNTIIYDLSGYQHNGTLKDITYSTDTPKYEVSSSFDATKTSYIKVNQNNWMAQGATDMTINIWAYMSDWSTWNGHRLFSCTESGGWNIQNTIANSLTFPVMVYTNANKTSTGYIPSVDRVSILKTDISSGWHMFTYTYNTTGCKCYLDAQLYQEKAYTSYGIYYSLGSSRLFLGCEANGTAPTGPYFTGKQSDFRIYYTTLSEADILKLYQKPVLADRNNNFYTYGNFNQINNNTISIEREAIVNINELHEIVRDNLLSDTSTEKTGNSANAQWFRWNVTNPYLTVNTLYTLSFDAKITNTSDVFYISFGNTDSTQQVIQSGTIVTTEYRRYTIVCQTTKTNINSIIMSNAKQYGRGNENNTGSTLYVKNIKLELGDYSTPYTQAGNNISNIYYTRDGLFIDNQSLEI